MASSDLGRQVRWMMALRAIIVTSLFLPTAILFLEELSGEGGAPTFGLDIRFLAGFIGVTYLLTLVYSAALRHVRNMAGFALLQIGVDILCATAVVYYTGVVTTPFLVLYLISVIAAAVLLDRRSAMVVASLAVLCYLSLLNLVYWGILPLRSAIYENVASIPVREVIYYIFVTLTGFFATSLLVNYLAERGRRMRTELLEVGEELTELQSFNERVIDNISGGLVVMTPQGEISFVNASGAGISGYAAGTLVGKPLSVMFPRGPAILEVAQEVLRTRKVFRFEDELASAGGRVVPVGASITGLPGAIPGSLVGYVLIFQDLTELRKLEAEVRLKDRLAAVGELAAGIAHEIRNPLASMSGSVQLLRAELSLSGDQRRLMDIVVDESRRLSRIIQDFLTFARPPSPRLAPVDVSDLVEQTLMLLRHSEEYRPSHELKVVTRGTSLGVLADAGQIKQVFWNLALNALSSMPRGGTLSIELDGESGDAVTVAFRDTGVGMSSERLGAIFTPFSSDTPGRSGLGLSIVYGILREHGGSIRAESEPGSGTTMTLTLRRRVTAAQPAEAAV